MSSKPEQMAVLEPRVELRFKGPFTEVTTARLSIRNPTDKSMCFKVKTTAPKRYCVRPNNGVIAPNKAVDIAVMLQPFNVEDNPQEKNKHKFMVQTMFVPEGEFANIETLWKEARPEDVMDSKLKCVFDLPGVASSSPIGGDGRSVESDQSHFTAVSQQVSEHAAPPPYSQANSDLEFDRLLEENKTLRDQLSAARREVIQLKEDSLRQRRATSSGDRSTSASSPGAVSSGRPSYSSAESQLQQQPAMSPVLLAVIALVLGLIFGKLLL